MLRSLDTNDYEIALNNPSNLCALWSTCFTWEKKALIAAMDKVIPLVQRRAVMRAAMRDLEDRSRRAAHPTQNTVPQAE